MSNSISSIQAENVNLPKIESNDYESRSGSNKCCTALLKIFSVFLIILTFPLSIWMCIKIVREYERAVIFRLGKTRKNGIYGPGMFFLIPCIDQVKCVPFPYTLYTVENLQGHPW